MEKCQIIHPFFWQINAKNLMPQAYYMLCRKFPDSYNKDSQAPYQLFRADQNCSFLQELWSRRSCGARPWEHRLRASLTWYVLVPETCPVSAVIRRASLYKPDTHSNFKVLRKVTFTFTFPSYLILGEPVQHATGVLWLISCSRSAFYMGISERVWGE